MTLRRHDVVVVGAGLVGLAAALRLTDRKPGADIVLVDKEADVAVHQRGRNSGVLATSALAIGEHIAARVFPG